MLGTQQKRRLLEGSGVFIFVTRTEGVFVLGRPGSDLLSQGLSHSTIGAEEFNGRVRDGIGFKLLARTTRPAKDKDTKRAVWANGEQRTEFLYSPLYFIRWSYI